MCISFFIKVIIFYFVCIFGAVKIYYSLRTAKNAKVVFSELISDFLMPFYFQSVEIFNKSKSEGALTYQPNNFNSTTAVSDSLFQDENQMMITLVYLRFSK